MGSRACELAVTLVATIDAGGSGVKLGVVSLDSWRTLASVRREYASVAREPGLFEWDPAEWWSVIEGALADAVEAAGEPPERYAGLICTGMRIPFVLVDDRCEPLAPGVLVPDVRGRVYLDAARDAIGAEALYATTGHWSAPHFGLPKLLWFVRERTALWARTRWVLQFCDWLLERLCGVVASEHSSASMSQMLDVSSREWAGGLLDAAGIGAERMPPLRAAGSMAGDLRPDVARRVGLLPGTPVHVGGGDTHVASLAASGLEGGSVTIVAGTTTPLMIATREPWLDPEVTPLVSAHVRPGRWAAETNVSTSGAMLRWLRDVTGQDYATLEERAGASPLGARGALVCAANPEWGASDWADVPPISLVGVGPAHGVGDLARAVLESSAHAVACNLARLGSLAQAPLGDVTLTGGGGRSVFAAQLLADVLGRRIVVPQLEDPAALGGALLVAGLDRPSVEPPVRVHEPDAERHAAYVPHTRRYAEVFARLRGAALGPAV
jgi:sugar (pentulose or hexulose) kinase